MQSYFYDLNSHVLLNFIISPPTSSEFFSRSPSCTDKKREREPLPPGRFALSISEIRGCSGLRVAAVLPFALPSSKSISMKHKNDVFLSYQGCRAVSRRETRSFF